MVRRSIDKKKNTGKGVRESSRKGGSTEKVTPEWKLEHGKEARYVAIWETHPRLSER